MNRWLLSDTTEMAVGRQARRRPFPWDQRAARPFTESHAARASALWASRILKRSPERASQSRAYSMLGPIHSAWHSLGDSDLIRPCSTWGASHALACW